MKYWMLVLYGLSTGYVHFRGQERLGFVRQLFDHSTILAPLNVMMYLCSAVPKTPYVAMDHFPELQRLADHWEEIRDEAKQLYDAQQIKASLAYDDIGFNSFFRRGWRRFYLKWYDNPLSSAQQMCPKTIALIKQIPCVNAAMFALLPKGSYLFKHRDPYAGSLRYHLGLITPNHADCCIHVDGQKHVWRDGEAVVFDETYVHHAKNETECDRIILFCDIKRPLTHWIARVVNDVFSRTVMRASGSKNVEGEPVGLINRWFGVLYQIRLVGKWLKGKNKNLYYLIKYSLFIGVSYLFFRSG